MRRHTEEHGFPPSYREIGRAVGIRSTKAVKYHLDVLVEQGLLVRTQRTARALRTASPPHTLPVVGRIAAGAPVLAVENVETTISLSRFQDCFLLRVQGESMTGAGIMNGDMVIVRQAEEPRTGDIVVALLGDEATVKRLARENGQVTLLPENPAFPPIVVESSRTDFKIVGVVIGLLRNYK